MDNLSRDPQPTAASRLKEILAAHDTLPAGRLQVVGLERIREQYGQRWETVAPKVTAMVRKVLERHLGPQDAYLPLPEPLIGFVMLFPALQRNEAEVKALFIATEIARRLLGDQAARPEEVTVTTVDQLDTSAIRSADDVTADVLQALVARPEGGGTPGRTGDRKPTEPGWRSAAATGGDLPSTARILYRPIWDVGRNVLSTFHCLAAPRDGNGQTVGYDMLLGGGRSTLIPELDRYMIDRAIHDLRSMEKRGRRIPVACTVHRATLADQRSREGYRRQLLRVPGPLRRYLGFLVAGLDCSIPESRLMELLAPLRVGESGLTAREEAEPLRFATLRTAGLRRVALDLSGTAEDDEAAAQERINTFVRRAHHRRMSALVMGLPRRSLVVAAVAAGADYVEGPAIHPPAERPGPAIHFHVDDLFALAPTASGPP